MSFSPHVLILGHHKIGPIPTEGWESWYYVSEEALASQLQLLRDMGYTFLDLDTFLQGIDAPETLPAKGVLMTFDDAYQSLLRYALPVLQEAACPGVVFAPTFFVGKTNHFDAEIEPVETICSWEDLAALEKGGIAVQSHGVFHRSFSTLSFEELEIEITQSKREIEAHLHRPVSFFSFPYGDNSKNPAQVEEILLRHGYRAACLYGGDPIALNPTPSNRFHLARIALGSTSDLGQELAALGLA